MGEEKKGIDLTPTWEALVPVLVEVAVRGDTPEAQRAAMDELLKLARAVDRMNARERGS